MAKSYSIVTVNDPCSMHHTVKLYPSQEMSLRLSSEVKYLKVSPFLEFVSKNRVKGYLEIKFRQKPDIVSWGEESSVYLGEIYGETNLRDSKFRLCVYMISNNEYKKDVITVFNPINQVIKLESYQILEVVLSDPYFSGTDSWKMEFRDEKRQLDIGFHELGKRKINLAKKNIEDERDKSDIYHLVSRTKDFWHPSCREHHYWFRFDNRMLPLVRTRSNDVYLVGDINFTGYGSSAEDDSLKAIRSLQVWLNIKSKHAYKVAQLLGIKNFGEVSDNPDSKAFLPIVSPINKRNKKKNRSYNASGTNYQSHYYLNKYDYDNYSTYISSRSFRVIDIKEVLNPVLGSGCKSKSLIPEKGHKPFTPYDWGKDEDVVFEAT